ncbi:MAG: peptidylprolyl isomerase [Acidimicrobiia bacterium]|nr:peptidylprolyl isomerase [Acidimicrobiia bacterium]
MSRSPLVGRLALLAGLALPALACGSPPATVATIDGIEIERARFESLHPDGYELVPDETASSLLLLLIHDLFIANAQAELGITLDEAATSVAFAARTRSAEAIGPLDEVLANRGVTPARVQLEANLDVLRELVGPELVRREAPGFDIDTAFDQYLLDEAYVCVQQIELLDTGDLELIIDRANSGDSFADLAREFSTDSLAHRPDGESGAGGDMGCSYPNSFGLGLADAALDTRIPVGEAFGPVVSAAALHVMVVYDRVIPELDDVRADVLRAAEASQGPDLFSIWAVDLLHRAEVTIDDGYGSWGPREGTDGIPTVIPVGAD